MVIDVESRALPNESNVELTLYMKTMIKYMESNKSVGASVSAVTSQDEEHPLSSDSTDNSSFSLDQPSQIKLVKYHVQVKPNGRPKRSFNALYYKKQPRLEYSEQLYGSAKQATRRWWVRPVLRKRETDGAFSKLVQDLEKEDPQWYFEYLRMTPTKFKELLAIVKSKIEKKHTNWRRPISAATRLALTIRHLATGESKRSLSYQYLIGRSTVTLIVAETTEAIRTSMKSQCLKPPTQSTFQTIADKFMRRWDFPNCIGAIDGKYIRLRCPENSGSTYFCHKRFFSVVLMAVVDADYKFQFVDVGAEGSAGDSSIFARSSFGCAILNGTIETPEPKPIPNGTILPHVFVADEAFPLKMNIMRPFPGGLSVADRQKRVYNYRLSRARLVVENAFGILAARWRIFNSPINCKLETVDSIVKACCCLHNFVMSENSQYCPINFVDAQSGNREIIPGAWRTMVSDNWLQRQQRQGANNFAVTPMTIRTKFLEYFNSGQGALPWQEEYLFG
ncbi:hypothetical protein QYM36_000310 [Artemia franciscana]|uniref:DDE Tnp4 domain-containing protein n=1 Tax=Artemia franciscana TaxID=6661 RepID=A0AA88IS22_ARTSF|nr:hypothetical protein QYM36_000310 [Artemia franciscana]